MAGAAGAARPPGAPLAAEAGPTPGAAARPRSGRRRRPAAKGSLARRRLSRRHRIRRSRPISLRSAVISSAASSPPPALCSPRPRRRLTARASRSPALASVASSIGSSGFQRLRGARWAGWRGRGGARLQRRPLGGWRGARAPPRCLPARAGSGPHVARPVACMYKFAAIITPL